MGKNLHKTNDVIDNEVIIVRNPAEKTLKKVSILKSMELLHFIFNRTETLQKHKHSCCF